MDRAKLMQNKAKNIFKRIFLPTGILVVTVIGLVFPEAGRSLDSFLVAGFEPRMLAIIAIFLVTGYCLDLGKLHPGRGFWAAAAAVVAINLLLAPAIAVGFGQLLPPASPILIGFMVFACVPTTLSSSIVISRAAGGNVIWAVSFMVLLNLAGLIIIPITLDTCLNAGGLEIDRYRLLLKILQLVLIPLGLGMIAQKYIRWKSPFMSYLPSAFVIFIVWLSVSRESTQLHQMSNYTILKILGLAGIFHSILLVISFGTGRSMRLGPRGLRAVGFVTAQKSLPLSISVLLMLEKAPIPNFHLMNIAMVTVILLYFPQILIDSVLAARMRHEIEGS